MTEDQYNELYACSVAIDVSMEGYINLSSITEAVREHGYVKEIDDTFGEELKRVIDTDRPLTKETVLEGLASILAAAIEQLTFMLEGLVRISSKHKDEDPGKVVHVLQLVKANQGLEILGDAVAQDLELPRLGKVVPEDLLRSFATAYSALQKFDVPVTKK